MADDAWLEADSLGVKIWVWEGNPTVGLVSVILDVGSVLSAQLCYQKHLQMFPYSQQTKAPLCPCWKPFLSSAVCMSFCRLLRECEGSCIQCGAKIPVNHEFHIEKVEKQSLQPFSHTSKFISCNLGMLFSYSMPVFCYQGKHMYSVYFKKS